jgi:hypothetical protein
LDEGWIPGGYLLKLRRIKTSLLKDIKRKLAEEEEKLADKKNII